MVSRYIYIYILFENDLVQTNNIVLGKKVYEAYLATTGCTSEELMSWKRGNLSDSLRNKGGFDADDTEDALAYWALLSRATLAHSSSHAGKLFPITHITCIKFNNNNTRST